MESCKEDKIAWVVYDAQKIGSLNQCLALCEELGYTPVLKPVALRFPYSWVAPFFSIGILDHLGLANETPPNLVIASGRQASGVAAALRSPQTKVIFILNPHISPKHFDAVIVPRHDHLSGENVLPILGGLHRIYKERLVSACEKIPVDLPKPCITILLGGDSQHFTYSKAHLKSLRDKAFSLREKMGGGSFLITPSRRTRSDLMPYLHSLFEGSNYILWNMKDPNPYLSFLGHADAIIATSDSISMVSEACGVGVPVFIEDLKIPHKKFQHFFNEVVVQGYAQFLEEESVPKASPPVLFEVARVAAFVKRRLSL